MRLILGSHPGIHAFDEASSYASVQEDVYRTSKRERYVALKMPIWTDYLVDSEAYKQYHREEDLIVFMFRDVRAVVGSMKTLLTDKGPFIEGVLKTMEDAWLVDEHRKFKSNCLEEYDRIKQLPHSDVRRAALFWKYKTSKYFEMEELGWKVLPVRYESLVQQPARSVEKLCRFIGVDWDDRMLQHNLLKHGEIDRKGFAVGNTRASRSIDAESVLKWKGVLSEDQERAILETAGDLNHLIESRFD